jgi:hypothetical protein
VTSFTSGFSRLADATVAAARLRGCGATTRKSADILRFADVFSGVNVKSGRRVVMALARAAAPHKRHRYVVLDIRERLDCCTAACAGFGAIAPICAAAAM